jgi:hypothetical protein
MALFTIYNYRTGEKLASYDVDSHEDALGALSQELIVEGPTDEKGHNRVYVMSSDMDEAMAITKSWAQKRKASQANG